MSAAMELHVALSLRLDAVEAYRLAHAYRDEVLAENGNVAAERDCLAMAVQFALSWKDSATLELREGIEEILATMPSAEEKATAPATTATPEVTVYRASHDSIVMGLYTTREAAQTHCEAKVQQEEPAGSIRHMSWSTDDIGPDAEYELHITPAGTGELIRGTGYIVTPLTVASAYDEEADE